MWMSERQRRVVCAAVKYTDGTMLVGPRHFDAVMNAQYHRFFNGGEAPTENRGVQGFLDQFGAFMDRFEALTIAQEAGQIRHKTHPADRLFSEDLY